MFLAVDIMPASGDCKFRWRSISEGYGLVEAFSGFQTLEWFLVVYIRIRTVVARSGHICYDRATDVCNANAMFLGFDQNVMCFNF